MSTLRTARETPEGRDPPLFRHPEWQERFPWLVQGVTGRGPSDAPFDLRLWGEPAPGPVLERWEALGDATGAVRVVHGRQVHGARVALHRETGPGLHLVGACDGHATDAPGVLLTVSLADCVPVFVVHPRRRAVALLHAGWRGTAAGILERGLETLAGRLAADPDDVHLHLGPAICGDCYEVGPEVHRALGLAEPEGPRPVDLREVLARRARDSGVAGHRITSSEWCTRCGDSPFFSHRGGDRGRHLGFLGVDPLAP